MVNVRRIRVVIQAAVTTVTIDRCVGKRALSAAFVARHTFGGRVATGQRQAGATMAFERRGVFPRRCAMAFFALLTQPCLVAVTVTAAARVGWFGCAGMTTSTCSLLVG